MFRSLRKRNASKKTKVKAIDELALIAREAPVRGHVDLYDGNNLCGWAVQEGVEAPVIIDVEINGVRQAPIKAEEFREDLLVAGVGSGNAGFTYALRVQELLNGFGGEPEIRAYANGVELIGSPLSVPKEEIRHSVDVYEGSVCAGWVVDLNNPHTQLDLDIYVDDEKVGCSRAGFLREDLGVLDLPNLYHGFHIDFSEYTNKEVYRVRVEFNYKSAISLAEEKTICSFHSKVNSLVDLQKYLRAHEYDKKTTMGGQLVHGILPALIDKVRADGNIEYEIIEHSTGKVDDRIAVIVPVYKGIEETSNCIESVVGSQNESDYRLLVINDCGPEEGMRPELERLQGKYGFELYDNEQNLGFVGTVNRGMREAEGCDVILLNSDTVVPQGWLDAIKNEAYGQEGADLVGTVTPISNNATICSFPNFCVDNEIPNGFSVEDIARVCSENDAPAVDMPTAHGYCMFIKRDVLREVGFFDEQKWGKGYAEENDFSLRASKLGWRHVVTNKTFVHHLGSVSFAEDSSQFIANNLDKLNGIYPDYPKLVERFVKEDPASVLRNEIAKRLMVSESKKLKLSSPAKGRSLLFVSLSIGGGTKVATDDLGKLLNEEGQSVYVLTAPEDKVFRVESLQSELFVDFRASNNISVLKDFLKGLGVWHVHYHHVLGFTRAIWDLPTDLGVAYDVTLHDFYTICPRVNFISYENEFCGVPDNNACNRCLLDLGVHESSKITMDDFGGDIENWRSFFRDRISKARRVIAPSYDASERFSRLLSLNNVEPQYHPEEQFTTRLPAISYQNHLSVAFIGAIGPHKGFNVLVAMAEYIESVGLPIRLTVIGYTCDDEKLRRFSCVKVTGRYTHDSLPGLIEKNGCQVAALFSVWPETFSYTFSEALRNNLIPVSFDIGAFSERVKQAGIGLTFPMSSPVEYICEELLTLREKDFSEGRVVGKKYSSVLKDYYSF